MNPARFEPGRGRGFWRALPQNPKYECRNSKQTRINPKSKSETCGPAGVVSNLGFRASNLLRISCFGFRIWAKPCRRRPRGAMIAATTGSLLPSPDLKDAWQARDRQRRSGEGVQLGDDGIDL